MHPKVVFAFSRRAQRLFMPFHDAPNRCVHFSQRQSKLAKRCWHSCFGAAFSRTRRLWILAMVHHQRCFSWRLLWGLLSSAFLVLELSWSTGDFLFLYVCGIEVVRLARDCNENSCSVLSWCCGYCNRQRRRFSPSTYIFALKTCLPLPDGFGMCD